MTTRDFLLDMSDGVFGLTWRRLQGLTDAELVWEPAPNCWSVRERADGGTRADWAPYIGDAEITESGYVRATRTGGDAVHPPPFTNLAWRIWHLTASYANSNAEQMLFGKPSDPVVVQPRRTSAAALGDLSVAHDRWRAMVASVRDDELDQPVAGGRHAGQTKAGYVLDATGHLIGHGAEIGMLRDLYAHVHRPDPLHADSINLAEVAWAGMWHAMPPSSSGRRMSTPKIAASVPCTLPQPRANGTSSSASCDMAPTRRRPARCQPSGAAPRARSGQARRRSSGPSTSLALTSSNCSTPPYEVSRELVFVGGVVIPATGETWNDGRWTLRGW